MKEKISTPSYADDVTIILAKEEESIKALRIVAEFGKASGLHINRKKTKAISCEKRKRHMVDTSIQWAGDLSILENVTAHSRNDELQS